MQNQFLYKDKIFHLTTINRQKTFYYRLTKPIEVWGNYHCQIAFFDNRNNIIYHRNNCFAHALKFDNSFGFVKWSENGDAVLFYEYRQGKANEDGVYHYLYIDLTKRTVYRTDMYKYDCLLLDNLSNYNFNKADMIDYLFEIGIKGEECYNDQIIVSPLKWLIGVDRWKPAARI